MNKKLLIMNKENLFYELKFVLRFGILKICSTENNLKIYDHFKGKYKIVQVKIEFHLH